MEDERCLEPRCERAAWKSGWCRSHYDRERRERRIGWRADCSVDGCSTVTQARGLCEKHYRRLLAKGSTDRWQGNLDRRFAEKWIETDSGCWEWQGAKWPTGYGIFKIKNTNHTAHRWAYERFVGQIPQGLTIDHLCMNRGCVNPAHLEPVTLHENILRGNNMAARYARRDSCLRGHTFDPPNGYQRKDGARGCRACDKIRADAKRERMRSKQAQ